MSEVPDAWDGEWSSVADKPDNPSEGQAKKISSKVTKAQKRAQQAEFNRQLWAEAEGPQEPNYFLESRNVVPLRSEFKPPPVLLSRKGPPIIQKSRPPTDALNNLDLNKKTESSDDEDEVKARELTAAERQAQATRDREEKQRKYEERRRELFGTSSNTNANANTRQSSQSGNSSPNGPTPPGSRSSTPSRGRSRGNGRGGLMNSSSHSQRNLQARQQELYDSNYVPKPDSFASRRAQGETVTTARSNEMQPVRAPRGPDGSGRGGFGFSVMRGAKQPAAGAVDAPA